MSISNGAPIWFYEFDELITFSMKDFTNSGSYVPAGYRFIDALIEKFINKN